jgi:hypothetical protein
MTYMDILHLFLTPWPRSKGGYNLDIYPYHKEWVLTAFSLLEALEDGVCD